MKSSVAILRIIAFAIIGYLLINLVGSTGETSIYKEQPWLWIVNIVILLFHTSGEVCLAALQTTLFKTLSKEQQEKFLADEAYEKENKFKWFKQTYKKLVGGKEIQEEHEIILDHNYDGIKELDNDLPPWWKYLFYITIVFAAVYLIRFEIFNDYSQDEEYELAVVAANEEIAAWKKTAKNLVDVNTVTLLTEEGDLAAGKNIFTNNCVACHKADGGGGIGPNLTDEYWILGGGIKNVFNTISEGGRSGKGMIPWKNELKPLEMAQVASYLLTFQGTTPAEPKEAEGEIWVDPDKKIEAAQKINEAVTDSTTTVIELNQ